MLSYPFIEAVATAVLQHSAAIEGRVWMAPFFGSELNSENLQQIVSDTLSANGRPKRYPLSIILPPVSTEPAGGWSSYTVQQVFLVQEGRDSGGNVKDLDHTINRSRHTITEDWHDMRRVAMNYLKQLRALAKRDGATVFRVSERTPADVIPVTRIGSDHLNGVLITYVLQLHDICADEDYAPGAGAAMVIPSGDQHPEHLL